MKFEFIEDHLIFKPKTVQTPQDVEDLDTLLRMMMHIHCYEISGAAHALLESAHKYPFVSVMVNNAVGTDGPKLFVACFNRQRDVYTGDVVKRFSIV